jgi:hypothetical protein
MYNKSGKVKSSELFFIIFSFVKESCREGNRNERDGRGSPHCAGNPRRLPGGRNLEGKRRQFLA